jgi:hypothetical protein
MSSGSDFLFHCFFPMEHQLIREREDAEKHLQHADHNEGLRLVKKDMDRHFVSGGVETTSQCVGG